MESEGKTDMAAVISIIRSKIKSYKNLLKRIGKQLDENVVLSFGENCLTDNILDRNGLKSFSSPYSSGRTNVEYILAFEREEFADLLNREYLVYEYAADKRVTRNKKYVATKNRYHEMCINGFEFTHHDVLGSKINGNKISKRCQRMLELKNKNIVIVYHHRLCEETDESLLISHLAELADIYRARGNDVSVFMFGQVLVSEEKQRKAVRTVNRGIHVYKFHTLQEWAGENHDVFWARCDDDLLKTMVTDIKQKLR